MRTSKVYTCKNILLTLISSLWFLTSIHSQNAATKVDLPSFKNLYRLNDSIYRSEQPSRKGFKALEAMGIKSVLNFRRNVKDDARAKKTQLHLKHIPLKTKALTQAQIVSILKDIQELEKPLLIHCWHGSDRTGVVSAAYRIIFENWSKDEAIEELRREEFGYHEKWYPNIIQLLREMDIEQVRQELGITKTKEKK